MQGWHGGRPPTDRGLLVNVYGDVVPTDMHLLNYNKLKVWSWWSCFLPWCIGFPDMIKHFIQSVAYKLVFVEG